jgi:hypothetical protein
MRIMYRNDLGIRGTVIVWSVFARVGGLRGARKELPYVPERGIVWSLAEPIDQWFGGVTEGQSWWKPLIEVLQGQPMTTHMNTRAHAWELYKRADSGEIV